MSIPLEIQEKLHYKYNWEITATRPISGGCIHNGIQLQTTHGDFFLKYNHLSSLNNFQAEEKGLTLLAKTKELYIPEILESGATENYAYLGMEFIASGKRAPDYWEDFGRRLARLHKQTQASFGLDHDNFIGALPQSNTQHANWIDFFIQERINPMVEMAIRKGTFEAKIRDDFEKLFIKLPQLFPLETPALLHGDLWGGNILSDKKGKVWLIDPAVYYGHREMELAFMTLFDSQPAEFYQAYQEVYPLSTGFASRFAIYNLYPLLVHVNLFGGSYISAVKHGLKALV